jgi:hypothetical protein
MKSSIFSLCVVFAFSRLNAQTSLWQPSPGHTQIPIWPGTAPDYTPPAPEYATNKPSDGGKTSWLAVVNVSQPTITGVDSPSTHS